MKKQAQTEMVARHLLQKGSITSFSALSYGVLRLAARIHDLRAGGARIKSVRCHDLTGRAYAKYELEGWRGDELADEESA